MLLNAATNCLADSFQAITDESWLPRRPTTPISTVGVPDVCPSANTINGSVISVVTVLMVVVVPLTVRLPVTVKSEPYVKLLANKPPVIVYP